ncbi:alpha/beta-hydrolase [Tothia fuscella]|uniref:Carboxylic ester hydrolase n=1 Tax=Tothia fuscella TaxID=1048955 RepID=A0A9P4TSP1_9PEZI|nr:alpha/beta-hydrolase [Tothia fuscella]
MRVLVVGLTLVGAVVSRPSRIPLVVRLQSGLTVEGHTSTWRPSVVEYLGIRYAEPPVGSLRFMPPKASKKQGHFVASIFVLPSDCPSNGVNLAVNITSARGIALASLASHGDVYNEDCLAVNVWTRPQAGETAKAVLLWIYGGGFSFGTAASPTYNGARLAEEQDVVVVTMNYRIGILGFPGAAGIEMNPGLLDQRMVVEWCRDNIHKFGGDPKRITLFGESAGAASIVLTFRLAWTKDPIVNGFILQSGTYQLGSLIEFIGTIENGRNHTARWLAAANKAGCGEAGKSTAEHALQCMQAKSWKDLLSSVSPAGITSSAGGLGNFSPIPDGKVVMTDYKARAAAGNFIKRPMLVGNNQNEGSIFLIILGLKVPLNSPIYSQLSTSTFTCPSASAAAARAAQKIPVWRYYFAGRFPNQDIGLDAGAFHGSEIPLVFGSTEYQQIYYSKKTNNTLNFPDTAEQQQLVSSIMGTWSTFAKDPDHGLIKVLKYPVYNPKESTLIQLGDSNSSLIKVIRPIQTDATCLITDSLATLFG